MDGHLLYVFVSDPGSSFSRIRNRNPLFLRIWIQIRTNSDRILGALFFSYGRFLNPLCPEGEQNEVRSPLFAGGEMQCKDIIDPLFCNPVQLKTQDKTCQLLLIFFKPYELRGYRKPVFFYRGNLLYAVRFDQYKV